MTDPFDSDPPAALSPIARFWLELRIAAGFLTLLPVGPIAHSPGQPQTPAAHDTDDAGGGDEDDADVDQPAIQAGWLSGATALFPLIGAGIGFASALALLASFHIGLHPLACALIALAVASILSGALHEDGLADFADGLGGGATREQRLAAMRDSRLGTFAVLALIFAVLLRAAMLSGLFSPETAAFALIAAASVSRATLPALMHWLPAAQGDGLAATAGTPQPTQVAIAFVIAFSFALVSVGFWACVLAMLAAAAAAAVVAWVAWARFRGKTGDVLGAAQVLSEIAAIAAIAAWQ